MTFDVSKPFGVIHGQCAEFPGAKFEQNGKLYNARHIELKFDGTDVDVGDVSAPPPPPVAPADTSERDTLEAKLLDAKAAATADPTPQKRATVTRLENKLKALK